MFSAALCLAAFAAPLQYQSAGASLEQILPEISRQSGVKLTADARVAEEVFAMRLDGKSLEWFMERAAWASGSTWRQTADGWMLERTASQEGALIRQAAIQQADASMADIQKASRLMPQVFDLFMKNKEEEAMQLMVSEFSDPAMMNEVFEQATMADVIEAIGLRTILAHPVGQTVRYAVRPNRLERPFTPAMRQGMQQVLARINQIMRASMMIEESLQQPELMALLNRRPNLDAASIEITRSADMISMAGQTGEDQDGGMISMGMMGPMSATFQLAPRPVRVSIGHPFGSEKPQAKPISSSALKPEEAIARLVEKEPLAETAGEPMLAAAEKAGSSFVALLPDALLDVQQGFGFGQMTSIESEALDEVEFEAQRASQMPQAPENSGLAGHFEWQDGAGRPWALGRAIESRFSRKAMGDMLKRHLAQKEGILTAALAVNSQVRPGAWGGAYSRMVEAAIPWLDQGRGLSQIGEGYAFFQFLSSLPRGVLKSLSQEPITRFDPGMLVRAENALCNTPNATKSQMGQTAPMDGVAYDFPVHVSGDSVRRVLGKVPVGAALFKLSGAGSGQILAYNARTGRLEVLDPSELGSVLGSAEDPAQADMRVHMPDYRSFSMVDRALWSLSARIASDRQEVTEVSATLIDIQPPAGEMAGLSRLPKEIQEQIEQARRSGRNGGGWQ